MAQPKMAFERDGQSLRLTNFGATPIQKDHNPFGHCLKNVSIPPRKASYLRTMIGKRLRWNSVRVSSEGRVSRKFLPPLTVKWDHASKKASAAVRAGQCMDMRCAGWPLTIKSASRRQLPDQNRYQPRFDTVTIHSLEPTHRALDTYSTILRVDRRSTTLRLRNSGGKGDHSV